MFQQVVSWYFLASLAKLLLAVKDFVFSTLLLLLCEGWKWFVQHWLEKGKNWLAAFLASLLFVSATPLTDRALWDSSFTLQQAYRKAGAEYIVIDSFVQPGENERYIRIYNQKNEEIARYALSAENCAINTSPLAESVKDDAGVVVGKRFAADTLFYADFRTGRLYLTITDAAQPYFGFLTPILAAVLPAAAALLLLHRRKKRRHNAAQTH